MLFELLERDIVVVFGDVFKSFDQFFFFDLASIFFNCKAGQQIFFGKLSFRAFRVDFLLDDAKL